MASPYANRPSTYALYPLPETGTYFMAYGENNLDGSRTIFFPTVPQIYNILNLQPIVNKSLGTQPGNVPVVNENGLLDPSIIPALPAGTSDMIIEGTQNLFFTPARASAAMTSQVTNLQTQISNMQSSNQVMSSQMSALQSSLQTAQADIATAKTNDQTMSAQISTLQTNTQATQSQLTTLQSSTQTQLSTLQTSLNSKLSANQNITLSGDVTGSGATAIAASLSPTGVTAGSYDGVTVDSKGRVTSGKTNSYNNNVTRAFVTSSTSANGFQISATRDAFVNYKATIVTTCTITSGQLGTILLEICATNSATASDWLEIGRFTNGQTGGLVVGLTLVQTTAGQLSGWVPAGWYVRLRTINTTGTPSFTYNTGQEALL
jgi:hypothetical protein